MKLFIDELQILASVSVSCVGLRILLWIISVLNSLLDEFVLHLVSLLLHNLLFGGYPIEGFYYPRCVHNKSLYIGEVNRQILGPILLFFELLLEIFTALTLVLRIQIEKLVGFLCVKIESRLLIILFEEHKYYGN